MAYNSREDVIYGTSETGGFFAISCDSNRVVSQFPLYGAFSVCYDSLDNKAFCTYHDWQWHDSLLVVDGSTHSRVKAISIPGATVAIWDPVLDRVYVSCQNSSQVAVVDCRTESLLAYVPVGRCPIKMYINVFGRKLYVLNYDDHSISVVDMTTNLVLATVIVGGYPNAGYYCRSVNRFYCGGEFGKVVVLDGRSDSVVARIPVASYSTIDAVSGSDVRDVVVASVYVGIGPSNDWLYTLDAVTNEVDTCIQQGRGTDAIYWSPLSDRFYCTSAFTNEVIVLSGDGRQHLTSLPVANCPFVIAQSPVQKRLYIGHLGSSKVYVIRDATTPWPEGQPSIPDTVSGLRLNPSPFRDRLSIVSGTDIAAGAVRVFSGDGRLVRSLNATKSAGKVLRLTWDGRDSRGRLLPPGVYVVSAPGGTRAKVVKLE
jgi:YVTN family beta-propeller protein